MQKHLALTINRELIQQQSSILLSLGQSHFSIHQERQLSQLLLQSRG